MGSINSTVGADAAPPPFPPPPTLGTGPGPLGVPGGTDRSYSNDIITCAVVTAVIGTVFVALRFYARRVLVSVLNWEDWLILASQIFSIGMCIGFVHQAVLGAGQHVWLIPPENFRPMGQAGWYSILFYELSLWLSQTSILLLYIRIWTFPWVRRAGYALMAIVALYNIFVTASVVTFCVPLQAFWDFSIKGAYCHPKSVFWANTYMHIIVDFLIYLLPMPIILRVQFPRRQKVLLFVLFAFGFFVCAISVVRLYILIITANIMDFPFDNVAVDFWSCVETNATVAVACFMTFKPLLAKWFPNLTKSSGQRQSPQDAMAEAQGRLPTIGSRPVRGSHRQMFMDVDRDSKEWGSGVVTEAMIEEGVGTGSASKYIFKGMERYE